VGEAMKEWNWLLLMVLGVWVFVFCVWLYVTFEVKTSLENWLRLGPLVVGGIGIALMGCWGRKQKKDT
jgi:hypothetical protein